jgi:tRNA uridine 5-carbamoylmethylation protein Kti12
MDQTYTSICLLMGLPASGKSTLARSLQATASLADGMHVVHIEFDDVYEEMSKGGDSFSPVLWHQAREACYERIRHLALSPSHMRQLILVDDNMHLRSMRRRCFRIARDCQAAFMIIHFRASLSMSLARNSERISCNKVREVSIQTMASSVEEPNDVEHKWEGPILTLYPPEAHQQGNEDRILSWISEHWRCVPPLIEDRKPRCQSYESLIHILDIETRKIVSLAVEEASDGKAKGQLALKLNTMRREALSKARDQLAYTDDALDAEAFVDELMASWGQILQKL